MVPETPALQDTVITNGDCSKLLQIQALNTQTQLTRASTADSHKTPLKNASTDLFVGGLRGHFAHFRGRGEHLKGRLGRGAA